MEIDWADDDPAYARFEPRPDQPERYDQQTAFYESQHTGITWMIGGNGAGTTEIALAKAAMFMLTTPPPRKDTPFWIISESYEMVCKACWKEKLSPLDGHGHLPVEEIDWDRIRWYRPNQGWPFEVPLRPWRDRPGKNWTISFKSYGQGRQQMQAESIGGFLFVEQFPWGLLEEVLRGTREYSFPGSKLCEFTPVDPDLSYELEEMLENDTIPEGWGIYRANTECALEAGHVSESWFQEFFGMVPEEMRETRMTGRFASYEGAIFQNLNPLVHYVGDKEIFPGGTFPPNVFHRRGKDWGAGPENADVCVWGYKNGKGQWFVYDEYVSTDQNHTVHDHLKAIAEKWHWPQQNPHYGMMYADPSDQGNIRIASKFNEFHPEYDNFSIQNASNRVFEGIDYLRYLMKPDKALGGQPRLFIHKKNCPYLCRTLRTYRWERSPGTGVNPRDAKPHPLKKDDHAVDALRYMVFSDANKTGSIPSSMSRSRDRKRHGVLVAAGSGR